jgi:hypothetical protein
VNTTLFLEKSIFYSPTLIGICQWNSPLTCLLVLVL